MFRTSDEVLEEALDVFCQYLKGREVFHAVDFEDCFYWISAARASRSVIFTD